MLVAISAVICLGLAMAPKIGIEIGKGLSKFEVFLRPLHSFHRDGGTLGVWWFKEIVAVTTNPHNSGLACRFRQRSEIAAGILRPLPMSPIASSRLR